MVQPDGTTGCFKPPVYIDDATVGALCRWRVRRVAEIAAG